MITLLGFNASRRAPSSSSSSWLEERCAELYDSYRSEGTIDQNQSIKMPSIVFRRITMEVIIAPTRCRSRMYGESRWHVLLHHLNLRTLYRCSMLYRSCHLAIDRNLVWRQLIERDLGVVPSFVGNMKLYYLRGMNFGVPLTEYEWSEGRVHSIGDNVVMAGGWSDASYQLKTGNVLHFTNSSSSKTLSSEAPNPIGGSSWRTTVHIPWNVTIREITLFPAAHYQPHASPYLFTTDGRFIDLFGKTNELPFSLPIGEVVSTVLSHTTHHHILILTKLGNMYLVEEHGDINNYGYHHYEYIVVPVPTPEPIIDLGVHINDINVLDDPTIVVSASGRLYEFELDEDQTTGAPLPSLRPVKIIMNSVAWQENNTRWSSELYELRPLDWVSDQGGWFLQEIALSGQIHNVTYSRPEESVGHSPTESLSPTAEGYHAVTMYTMYKYEDYLHHPEFVNDSRFKFRFRGFKR